MGEKVKGGPDEITELLRKYVSYVLNISQLFVEWLFVNFGSVFKLNFHVFISSIHIYSDRNHNEKGVVANRVLYSHR